MILGSCNTFAVTHQIICLFLTLFGFRYPIRISELEGSEYGSLEFKIQRSSHRVSVSVDPTKVDPRTSLDSVFDISDIY